MPPSRRTFLATASLPLFGGCTRLRNLVGNEQPPPPAPFLSEPGDWEHPEYDAANTNAPPGYAAPDSISTTPDWTAEFSVDTIDHFGGPLVADGMAYFVFTGVEKSDEFQRLVALDVRTGDERWRVTRTGIAHVSPPTVAGESVFWLPRGSGLYALNAADGSKKWTHEESTRGRPLVGHGLVLVVGGTHREPVLQALDPQSGRSYWTRSDGERGWRVLAADDDAFYVRLGPDTSDDAPELHALDPRTGETLWATSRVSPRNVALRSGYLVTSTGRPDARELLVLDIETRDVEWTETRDLQRSYSNGTVNGRQSVAAVTDEFVLVHLDFHGRFHDRIEARSLESGEVIWTHEGSGAGRVSYTPVVAGDRLYVAEMWDTDRETTTSIRVLDLADGTVHSDVSLSASSWRAIVADGRFFHVSRPSHETVSLSAR